MTTQSPPDEKPARPVDPMGVAIIIGLSFGMLFGVAVDNLAVGIAIGLTFGIVFGAAKRKERERSASESDSSSDAQDP